MKPIAALCIISGILAGCTNVPMVLDKTRVGPDYSAVGNIGNLRASLYANHTLVEADGGEEILFSTENGEPIQSTRIGNKYRLDRFANSFVARSRGRATLFVLDPATWQFNSQGASYNTAVNK